MTTVETDNLLLRARMRVSQDCNNFFKTLQLLSSEAHSFV